MKANTVASERKNIVVDVNHPAHVHFFKHFIGEMRERGHNVLITASDKDVTIHLLNAYGFDFVNMGTYGNTVLRKIVNVPLMDLRMVHAVRTFRPEVLLGIASSRAAHTAFVLRKKSIVFDDSEHKGQLWAYLPFASTVVTPTCFRKNLGKKHLRYAGYHELAYLHPHRFTPNPRVLDELGLSENTPFFIVRFVAWRAVHDMGEKGFTENGKRQLVRELMKRGKVIITSEESLPPDLQTHSLSVSLEKVHDLLYYATMYVGEGATMASEAAVLGTPSVYVSSISAGTLEEQEKKYDLLRHFKNEEDALRYVGELLSIEDLKERWREKRATLLKDKIDVTEYMTELVEKTRD
jgi:uncharacterized protein